MKQAILFTPGPLNTSSEVKQAMQLDLGTRDQEYMDLVKTIQHSLLDIAEADSDEYACTLLQGSGTYGVESVLTTCISKQDHLLILANGAYGQRMGLIAQKAGLPYTLITFDMLHPIPLDQAEDYIKEASFTHIAFVHNETTAGILNPLNELYQLASRYHKQVIVDAMSSFGGIPISLRETPVDYLITSSNKCLHGVPGIAILFSRISSLEQCAGNCPSLSLDLYEQYRFMKDNGGFRFTSPTHVLLALHQALRDLQAGGGVLMRNQRYCNLQKRISGFMRELGFQLLVEPAYQAPIITTFATPDTISFSSLYDALKQQGILLYAGKLPGIEAFRIGNIGELSDDDISYFMTCMKQYMEEIK